MSVSMKLKEYREYADVDKIKDALDVVSKDIYNLIHYDNIKILSISDRVGVSFYDVFKNNDITLEHITKLLTDGYLTYELVDNGESILGINEVNVASIVPSYKNGKRYWVQYIQTLNERVFRDDSLIHASYSEDYANVDSYVASLIRPYSVLLLASGKVSNNDYEYLESNFERATKIPKYYSNKHSNTTSLEESKRSSDKYMNFISRTANKVLRLYEKIYKEDVKLKNGLIGNNKAEVKLNFKNDGVFNYG